MISFNDDNTIGIPKKRKKKTIKKMQKLIVSFTDAVRPVSRSSPGARQLLASVSVDAPANPAPRVALDRLEPAVVVAPGEVSVARGKVAAFSVAVLDDGLLVLASGHDQRRQALGPAAVRATLVRRLALVVLGAFVFAVSVLDGNEVRALARLTCVQEQFVQKTFYFCFLCSLRRKGI